ncbi:MAG: hypothetical protein QM758_05335 [Armatimonas sp.]
MATSDPLPTPAQRELLCDMIHDAFVELRSLGWEGRPEQAADLADAFHNIPKEMHGWGNFSWSMFRSMLENYHLKWGSSYRNYVIMLDKIRKEQ